MAIPSFKNLSMHLVMVAGHRFCQELTVMDWIVFFPSCSWCWASNHTIPRMFGVYRRALNPSIVDNITRFSGHLGALPTGMSFLKFILSTYASMFLVSIFATSYLITLFSFDLCVKFVAFSHER